MKYFTNLFSPETYTAFMNSNKETTGFRQRQAAAAQRVSPGDRLLCYLTELSRWFGVLEVVGPAFTDSTPIFVQQNDPFVVRLKVRPVVLLEAQKALPIRDDEIWRTLSFTKEHDKALSTWTGKLRGSLTELDESDGAFLYERLLGQTSEGAISYPLDDRQLKLLTPLRVRRTDRDVAVTVPDDSDLDVNAVPVESQVRESHQIQALVADIGNRMRDMALWIPRPDRSAVIQQMSAEPNTLLERLPMNYDDTTLSTIENIDVLWIRRRSIVRAFEIEHSTAVYSGILRMADLLALQPNMDIRLHIVAPTSRREKVLHELRRPVFSLLDRGPLAEACTYISYDSVRDLANLRHMDHMDDTIVDEYIEEAG